MSFFPGLTETRGLVHFWGWRNSAHVPFSGKKHYVSPFGVVMCTRDTFGTLFGEHVTMF